jgi:hypothetical protein
MVQAAAVRRQMPEMDDSKQRQKADREARLEAALRENLRRRKAQSRLRVKAAGEGSQSEQSSGSATGTDERD